jgi:SAM-dependent methyltransferase
MITVDFNRLDLESGCRILDIGCGDGRHVAAAARRPGVFVAGADRRFKDLYGCVRRMAFERKMKTLKSPWALAAADILALPFPEGAFDLVICCEVLEHVADHERAAAELARVLKPGKTLVVSVPRYLPERICWAFSEAYAGTSGGHVRIYRQHEVRRLLEGFGLSFRRRHYAHALHSPYWWLKCLLGPEREDTWPVALYHRLLVWDMMKKPRITGLAERLLNPLLGKSLVLYLKKEAT